MIDSLPTMKIAHWLQNISAKKQPVEFPLNKILKDSLYYPTSGFDGEPIRFFMEQI